MTRVGLVGEGERFEAFVRLLARTKTEISLWQPGGAQSDLPSTVERVEPEALAENSLIFLSLPMHEVREVARLLGDHLTGRHAIVHLCRNLEFATLKTTSDILIEETPTHRFGFLSGPMRREDIEAGLPAAGVCATGFPEVQDYVEEVLVSEGFRLYRSQDRVGAEVAAAYSRIIALASGVAHELGLGASLQSILFARGLAEMARFVVYRGGFERTTFGMAGTGNLYADTIAPGSLDFRIGVEATRAGRLDRAAVAADHGSYGRDLLNLVDSLTGELAHAGLDLHILETCHLLVSGELSPTDAVGHLMRLPTLAE